jgi:hypothetical protein
MIRYIFISLFLFNQSIVFSQSILSNKPKYQVKVINSPLTYMAIFPLQNGDRETYKNVELTLLADDLNKNDITKLLELSTYIDLNYKAKQRCKNPYSWKPSKIFITKDNIEDRITVTVIGSAENSYGGRGEVIFIFEYLEGMFFKLG